MTIEQSHQTIICGNLWLKKWTKNQIPKETLKVYDKEFSSYINKLDQRELKIILITLDYDDRFPKEIIDFIKIAPREWYWLVRLKPNGLHLRRYWEAIFKDCPNIEIAIATALPIYCLLKKVDLHIPIVTTSSVVWEASQFGVKSILYYDGRIDKGDLEIFPLQSVVMVDTIEQFKSEVYVALDKEESINATNKDGDQIHK